MEYLGAVAVTYAGRVYEAGQRQYCVKGFQSFIRAVFDVGDALHKGIKVPVIFLVPML